MRQLRYFGVGDDLAPDMRAQAERRNCPSLVDGDVRTEKRSTIVAPECRQMSSGIGHSDADLDADRGCGDVCCGDELVGPGLGDGTSGERWGGNCCCHAVAFDEVTEDAERILSAAD